MIEIKPLVRNISAAMTILVCLSSAGLSQEQSENSQTPLAADVVTEDFEGDNVSMMLGGQIDVFGNKSPWQIYVRDGMLVMENGQSPRSLHYNDISWIKFPDSETLESTEEMLISAEILAVNDSNGGAGILVGSGQSGRYIAFTVDGQGRFHVLKKDGRKLQRVHSASHPAVNAEESNVLSYEIGRTHISLFANGTKVIQLPYGSKSGSSRKSNGQAGIGLAAFGTGEFYFDNVEISRQD